LRPGQRIRVPAVDPAPLETAADGAEEDPSDTAPEQPPETGILAAVRKLVERERYPQAQALLLSSARAGKLDQEGQMILAHVSVAVARAACRSDEPEQALKARDHAAPWLVEKAQAGRLADQRSHAEGQLALGRAEQALERGDYDAAFAGLLDARELAPDLRRTHGDRLEQAET